MATNGGGWTACFAATHGNATNGFTFSYQAWGATAPRLGTAGNRCAALAPTELYGEVYASSSASTPQIRTGAIPVPETAFNLGTFQGFSAGGHCIGFNHRAGMAQNQIGGTACTTVNNSLTHASGVSVSNGTQWRGLHGRINNFAYAAELHMCEQGMWCGTDTSAWIGLYGR